MSNQKLNPEQIFASPDAVAALVAASEIFGFVRRKLDLPPQWAAMVRCEGGAVRAVETGGVVDGSGAENVLLVRTTPVDVEIRQDGIGTSNGFLGRVRVQLRVTLIPDRGELEAFQSKVLGSGLVATTSTLEQYFEAGVRRVIAKFAGSHEASALTDGSQADAMKQVVADAAEASCFASGLKLIDAPRVWFESEAFRKVRVAKQDAARRRQEHQAAQGLRDAIDTAREAHLDRLSQTLSRLKDLADQSPGADLPVLMRTFAEHERGELYEALFASQAAGGRTQAVVVATAHQLLHFDPSQPCEPVRRVDVDGSAGPVRSVQWASEVGSKGRLLIGAAAGVYLMSPDASTPEETYLVEGSPSVRGGFNAAGLSGDQLFASHSELGVYRWPLGQPDRGEPMFVSMTRQAKAIRAVQCHDGDIYCAVDDRVIAWPADGPAEAPTRVYSGSDATITAVCVGEAGVFAGNSNGQILHWSGTDDTRPDVLHGGSRRSVESVCVVCCGGVRRLIYTDTSLCVYARVLGDTFTCRYEASGQTLRRVEVAPDLITATNDLRDRLLHWTPGKPQQPTALSEVGRITGHSVQDVCLVVALERTQAHAPA